MEETSGFDIESSSVSSPPVPCWGVTDKAEDVVHSVSEGTGDVFWIFCAGRASELERVDSWLSEEHSILLK